MCIKTYQPPAASTDMGNPFVGKTLVVTGKVEPYTRDGINAKIESLGAHAGSSVSSKTDYLICGENAGSKLAKAQELGIRDCVNVSSDIGPFLIINGEAQDVDGVGGGLNPRTAIGQRADGAILLLVVDGRQVTSLGASFSDLQDIMLQYGAVNASAMDGLIWMKEG